jgi:hypothetical protein
MRTEHATIRSDEIDCGYTEKRMKLRGKWSGKATTLSSVTEQAQV